MPATVADPNRSLDSEQVSPATIAHHTVYEKTPNLHQSHICQWGAQPYLVGPLSRLVGKPPHSPWVSADVLPLTQVVNNTNSAIPLTEIFDRVFSDVCNSLGFEVQKQKKNGDRGTIVFTATLNPFAPVIRICERISHAVQLLLHLANNDAARTQIYNDLCQECGGYRQEEEYGRIEVHSFLLKRRERTLAARSAVLEMLEG